MERVAARRCGPRLELGQVVERIGPVGHLGGLPLAGAQCVDDLAGEGVGDRRRETNHERAVRRPQRSCGPANAGTRSRRDSALSRRIILGSVSTGPIHKGLRLTWQ
jgi:hypothetical protein